MSAARCSRLVSFWVMSKLILSTCSIDSSPTSVTTRRCSLINPELPASPMYTVMIFTPLDRTQVAEPMAASMFGDSPFVKTMRTCHHHHLVSSRNCIDLHV